MRAEHFLGTWSWTDCFGNWNVEDCRRTDFLVGKNHSASLKCKTFCPCIQREFMYDPSEPQRIGIVAYSYVCWVSILPNRNNGNHLMRQETPLPKKQRPLTRHYIHQNEVRIDFARMPSGSCTRCRWHKRMWRWVWTKIALLRSWRITGSLESCFRWAWYFGVSVLSCLNADYLFFIRGILSMIC